MFRPIVFDLIERHWRLWPAVLALFLAVAALAFPTAWSHIGPLTFAISLTGIAGFLLLARRVSTIGALAGPLSIIGGFTLTST